MSLYYCKHTCPAVDSERGDLVKELSKVLTDEGVKSSVIDLIESMVIDSCERMKEVGTYPLREGLDACYDDLISEQGKVKDKEGEIGDLENKINILEDEMSDLEDQLNDY